MGDSDNSHGFARRFLRAIPTIACVALAVFIWSVFRPGVIDYDALLQIEEAMTGSIRDWLRHGSLNITQGKNFDASGSLGPWIVPSDDLDPGKPLRVSTRAPVPP